MQYAIELIPGEYSTNHEYQDYEFIHPMSCQIHYSIIRICIRNWTVRIKTRFIGYPFCQKKMMYMQLSFRKRQPAAGLPLHVNSQQFPISYRLTINISILTTGNAGRNNSNTATLEAMQSPIQLKIRLFDLRGPAESKTWTNNIGSTYLYQRRTLISVTLEQALDSNGMRIL